MFKIHPGRSRFFDTLRRLPRALARDLRVAQWSTARRREIAHYLTLPGSRKLHIGAGYSVLPGWLDTDIIAKKNGIVYLDATRPFPLPDNSFDYVFSEHMIEHIGYDQARYMLAECHRILKPGGRIRVATPDLGALLGLRMEERTPEQQHYVDWIVEQCLPGVESHREVFVINNAFRAWGHQFLYDRETLRMTLSVSGFEDLVCYKPGVSDDEALRGLESHGKEIGDESINQFETQVWEGVARKRMPGQGTTV